MQAFGSVEPKTLYKFEDGAMVCYSYAIHRDRDGNETSRTEPEAISRMWCPDADKPSLFRRFLSFIGVG